MMIASNLFVVDCGKQHRESIHHAQPCFRGRKL
jgi:hypothetical protein